MPGTEMLWSCDRVTADAVQNMQFSAGLLLSEFSTVDPQPPQDADILCATTGDFNFYDKPIIKDFFEDVNGAGTGFMEGQEIEDREQGMTVTALTASLDMLKFALGSAANNAVGGDGVRGTYKMQTADFRPLYWIGNMARSNKLMVCQLDNAYSVGGLNFTSTHKGKGKLALEIKPFRSLKDQEKSPMKFYILTQKAGA